jgi:hypothetical protein
VSRPPNTGAPGPPLPRPPRPLTVHWLVDAAVAFLALVVVGLLAGVPILAIAVVAAVVGLVAAPLTRRLEVRALAARAADRESP